MTADPLHVSDVRLVEADASKLRRGLIGVVTCTLNGSIPVRMILRRMPSGRPGILFPTRRDADHRERVIARLLDADRRRVIEDQIFLALGIVRKGSGS